MKAITLFNSNESINYALHKKLNISAVSQTLPTNILGEKRIFLKNCLSICAKGGKNGGRQKKRSFLESKMFLKSWNWNVAKWLSLSTTYNEWHNSCGFYCATWKCFTYSPPVRETIFHMLLSGATTQIHVSSTRSSIQEPRGSTLISSWCNFWHLYVSYFIRLTFPWPVRSNN